MGQTSMRGWRFISNDEFKRSVTMRGLSGMAAVAVLNFRCFRMMGLYPTGPSKISKFFIWIEFRNSSLTSKVPLCCLQSFVFKIAKIVTLKLEIWIYWRTYSGAVDWMSALSQNIFHHISRVRLGSIFSLKHRNQFGLINFHSQIPTD